MTNGYDVIVVGGGHNGLTAACYLAKAGTEGPGAGGARRGRRRLRHEGGRRAGVPAQLPLELPRDHPHGAGLPRPRAAAPRRRLRLAGQPVLARLPRRAGAGPEPQRREDRREHRAVLDARRGDVPRTRPRVPAGAGGGHDPGDVLPARAAVGRPGAAGGLGRGPRPHPAVPVHAEPRRAEPVRVARGPDVAGLLGGAAGRHRRRVRPGRQLPDHAGRLAGAVRLGDLQGRLEPAGPGDGGVPGGARRRGPPRRAGAPHRHGRRRGARRASSTTARASRWTACCCRTSTRATRSSSWSASPTCPPSSSPR